MSGIFFFKVKADDFTGSVDDIIAQINVLNQGFSFTGLSFDLQNISYFQDPDWFENLSQDTTQMEMDMKGELRQGDAATLNVYSVGWVLR